MTEDTYTNFELWTTKSIALAALEREEKITQLLAEGKTQKQIPNLCPSVGVKSAPFWPFILVTRGVLPELHILIGIGNKIMNNFWDIVYSRIEILPDELVEIQNITILGTIALKRVKEEHQEASRVYKEKVQLQKDFNKLHKSRKLSDEQEAYKKFRTTLMLLTF